MMKKVKLLYVLLLPGLASCSMLGSGPSDPLDELRARIAETVLDAQRAEVMLTSVDRLDELLVASADILADTVSKERELFRDYDSTPEDYRDLISAARVERRRVQEQLIDAHFAMKSVATPQEWDAIRPVQGTAIAAHVESLVTAATTGP